MAKPDNRADNVEHLQKSINNTIENMEEAESYLSEHADELGSTEREQIQEKNARRERALKGLRSEIRDEANNENQF